ncbi:hypothetical protein SPBR_05211 [Sporothrix brasiliensis 5110]|uniref:Protein kinase domain-containing protein n=1 Tax=Sporothrix brasiliensis 5110 TaxID=1398154 RepID=A0A0C2ELV2_9PEZI|nr:uncharacterized protein SPBR_05211 [Sporothrix brasiliensis 5110]KIH87099.1 hypothetical protein SPBR_05211 [Sporothrix brasiliensis 5110]
MPARDESKTLLDDHAVEDYAETACADLQGTSTAAASDRESSQTSTSRGGSRREGDAVEAEALPITPPLGTECRDSYRCIVDYRGAPYKVTWRGKQQYPDFSQFPRFAADADAGAVAARLPQSPEMTSLWKASTLVDFGSYASIRRHSTSRCPAFPMVKLAHPDDQARRILQHEFAVLCRLMDLVDRGLDLPVVRMDPEPIVDGGVLCGFRMEELIKLPVVDFATRKDDATAALQQLHAAGFSHGDVQPSNFMQDKTGRIVLIDFGFAGRIGHELPLFFPRCVYESSMFHKDADMAALSKW